MAGDRWLAVGDAALALDPLSSQGILTAMYSGMLAGRALDTHLSGNPKRLASYPARLGAIATAYRRNRQAFYAMEWRWPDQAFWPADRPKPTGHVKPRFTVLMPLAHERWLWDLRRSRVAALADEKPTRNPAMTRWARRSQGASLPDRGGS